MKRRMLLVGTLLSMAMAVALSPVAAAAAEPMVKYACSAQVYDAIEKQRIEAFTKQTGIRVLVDVWSSTSAVNALMRGICDVASSTRELYHRSKEYGYVDTCFGKDPLAIIVNSQNPLKDISEEDLRDIFQGNIGNWKELGGPDQPILIVIPGKNTAAYKNFLQVLLRKKEIVYDLMSYKSTTVVETVKRFPWAISFIAQGAAFNQEGVKLLSIDGLDAQAEDYPYQQIFRFVTRGQPEGAVKAFIDHAFSDEATRIMQANGILPFRQCEE